MHFTNKPRACSLGGMFSKVWVVARIVYFAVSELIGLAGVPDDLAAWRRVLMNWEPFLEHMATRAFLIISGGLVITYPQWKPYVARKLSRMSIGQDVNSRLSEKDRLWAQQERHRRQREDEAERAAKEKSDRLHQILIDMGNILYQLKFPVLHDQNLVLRMHALRERLDHWGIECPDPGLLEVNRWTLYLTLLRIHLEVGDIDVARKVLSRTDDELGGEG